MPKNKSILKLSSQEVENFLLKQDSYCNFNLPPYIKFEPLLDAINKIIKNNNYKFECIKSKNPNNFDDVNYKLFNNKNGKYDWRLLELINPILYVYLVREITKDENWNFILNRFKYLNKNSFVKCCSIPIKDKNKSNKRQQIIKWWNEVEQESIKYSVEFEYLFNTDITNFYPSIYTHSISWALHEKEYAKKYKGNNDLLGNVMDKIIMAMCYGQTNGIPQGSILMDFIAEILLAYIDNLLTKKLQKIKEITRKNCKIIRYRDDYRIFTNNPKVADLVLKYLSEILMDMGLKLNPHKTTSSQNIIQDSIKKDKNEWLFVEENLKCQTTLQKQLIILHKFALINQNSGTLEKILPILLRNLQENSKNNNLFKKILKKDIEVIISILVDIVLFNPRIFPVAMSILGILFKDTSKKFIKKIYR